MQASKQDGPFKSRIKPFCILIELGAFRHFIYYLIYLVLVHTLHARLRIRGTRREGRQPKALFAKH